MDQVKMGSFLKELRKEKGFTQEQLAEQLNVSNRSVSRWETGNTLPDISILIELAEFYDSDIKEIIDGERKSEKMNEEIKETLVKVADYTDAEKENIIRKLFGNIIGAAVVFLGVLVVFAFELNKRYAYLDLPMYLSWFGLCFSVGGIIQILQIRGNMSKQRLNKMRKILLPICVGVFLLAMITVFAAIFL